MSRHTVAFAATFTAAKVALEILRLEFFPQMYSAVLFVPAALGSTEKFPEQAMILCSNRSPCRLDGSVAALADGMTEVVAVSRRPRHACL